MKQTHSSTPAPASEPDRLKFLVALENLDCSKCEEYQKDQCNKGHRCQQSFKLVNQLLQDAKADVTVSERDRILPVLEQCEATLKRAIGRSNELCDMASKLGATPQNQGQYIALLEMTIKDAESLRQHMGGTP